MTALKQERPTLPATALVLAPAKVNLYLRVLGCRDDGYHFLDSLVAPIRLFDRLRVCIRPAQSTHIDLQIKPAVDLSPGPENLAFRAAALYLRRTGRCARVAITLHKRIPVGAGLGGGSSDAAAVLRALNALSSCPVDSCNLADWALGLGADVPFFLLGGSGRMRGVGERLSPTPSPLPTGQPLVVAFLGAGLATAEVYRRYDDSLTTPRGTSTTYALTPGQGPLQDWLINDLEAAAVQIIPTLMNLKRQLRALGARGVVMTGSGSAILGVWNRWDDACAAAQRLRADGTWACVTEVLEKVPAVERDEQHGGRSPSW